MARTTIRKINGQWTTTRPGYGFTTQTHTRQHANWRCALHSTQQRPSTTSTDTERRPQYDYDEQRPPS